MALGLVLWEALGALIWHTHTWGRAESKMPLFFIRF